MKMILSNFIKNKQRKNIDQGFSLVETMIALTTLGICLAYAMPLFLYAKINNSKSEIRTGALIVSQRVFDDIRSRRISTLPTDSAAPEIKTKDTTSNGASDQLIVKAMGRNYQSKVTFCEVAADCSTKYRKFKVEIFYNGTTSEPTAKVYDLEGTFTEFE
jgi:prepilin-type N-terminal cleavage/methylation domain-containing protein